MILGRYAMQIGACDCNLSDWDIVNAGFDHKTLSLMVALEEQSPDISGGVWKDKDDDDCGAGDQASATMYEDTFSKLTWLSS